MSKNIFKNKIKISKNLNISNKDKCFIVAEISANHSGNLNLLKKTMLKAKKIGADAVKIQTYQANTITLNGVGLNPEKRRRGSSSRIPISASPKRPEVKYLQSKNAKGRSIKVMR